MPTTDQIREQKLAKIILDQTFENADPLGEALLKYAFVGEGRGCYSNFELQPSFRLWEDGKDVFAHNFLGVDPLDFDVGTDSFFSEEELKQNLESLSSYLDPELDLAIVWDWSNGDGHLIFKLGGIILENTDIKCSYGWEFIS